MYPMNAESNFPGLAAQIAVFWPLLGLAAIPLWWIGRDDRVRSLRLTFSILLGLWLLFFALRFTAWVASEPLPAFIPSWIETVLFFAAGLGLAAALLIVFSLRLQPPKPAYQRVKKAADLLALSNDGFERLVQYTYQNIGYTLEKPANPSQARLINFIATGANSPTHLVHSHRYAGRVGEPVLRELIRMLDIYPDARIDVITTSTFSPQAETYAQNKPFHLIDADELIRLFQRAQKAQLSAAAKKKTKKPARP